MFMTAITLFSQGAQEIPRCCIKAGRLLVRGSVHAVVHILYGCADMVRETQGLSWTAALAFARAACAAQVPQENIIEEHVWPGDELDAEPLDLDPR